MSEPEKKEEKKESHKEKEAGTFELILWSFALLFAIGLVDQEVLGGRISIMFGQMVTDGLHGMMVFFLTFLDRLLVTLHPVQPALAQLIAMFIVGWFFFKKILPEMKLFGGGDHKPAEGKKKKGGGGH